MSGTLISRTGQPDEDRTIAPLVLAKLRAAVAVDLSRRYAVYQNHAMDSASLGHVQYLAIGPYCTFKKPPARMPDTKHYIGWKYVHVGWVDLERGVIVDVDNVPDPPGPGQLRMMGKEPPNGTDDAQE